MRNRISLLFCLVASLGAHAQQTSSCGIESNQKAQTLHDCQRIQLNCLNSLHQASQYYAKQLGLPERMLWIELLQNENKPLSNFYIQWNQYRSYKRGYSSYQQHQTAVNTHFLRAWGKAQLDLENYKVLTQLGQDPRICSSMRRQSQKLLHTIDAWRYEKRRLEQRKIHQLAIIEQKHIDKTANVSSTVHALKHQKTTSPQRLLSIASPRQGQRVCMIHGHDELLRTGDSVGNLRIAKVSTDSVEFEQDGKSWTEALDR